MDSETFAAYESGCTCWRLVDQYVGWDEQPTEMLGITIFTGAMPDGERLPGLPSRYEAFRLVMKALDRYILGDSDPLHLDLGSPDSMIRSNMRDAARKPRAAYANGIRTATC